MNRLGSGSAGGLRRALRRYRRRHGRGGFDGEPMMAVWLLDAMFVALVSLAVWSGLDLALGRGLPDLGELTAIGMIAGGAGWGSWQRGWLERGPRPHPGRW